MPTQRRKLGDLGEKLACKFLKNNGYSVLEVNYQKRIGEIDVIVKSGEIIHFIEVKTRTKKSSDKYGLPQEAVTSHKKKRLIRTALFYLAEHKHSDNTNWQIDVIAIIIDENRNKAKINHIENAISYDSL
ncbi:MAG: YraN family protein [Candidatus Pacebacteria bacterium]|nr:YraN family protein [Candidatus Paceibacterota bacterium]